MSLHFSATGDYTHCMFDNWDENFPAQTSSPPPASDPRIIAQGYSLTIQRLLRADAPVFANMAYGQLLEAETDNMFEGNPAERAELYNDVIENLLKNQNAGNNLLINAFELYKKANESSVWENYPVLAQQAEQLIQSNSEALAQQGITF